MNKIAAYLQEHVSGEVLTSVEARRYFSTDASVLTMQPGLIVYPRNTGDMRKVARFCWQLAEKGHRLPITARGRGTDLGGAAIGKGILTVFPAHMNRILELDTKQRLVRLQPGMTFRSLQDVLQTHGLFLPPYPASYDYSSVGGAIANNSAGEKSIKYGSMRDYVRNLEVVLANGDIIQTKRLNKRELNRKKGQTNFEGELYRQLDGLITDNWDMLQEYKQSKASISKNSSGYALADVKQKDGSFDLTPLLVGSQGTLGVVTEAILSLETHMPTTTLVVIECHDIDAAEAVIEKVLPLGPSALEMVDGNLLTSLSRSHPALLKGVIEAPYPDIVLLAEFNDVNRRKQTAKAKRLPRLLKGAAASVKISENFEEQETLWSIRRSAAAVMAHVEGGKSAVPVIEDGIVPRDKFKLLLAGLYALLKKYHLEVAVWGHAGDANLHVQPMMDLSQTGDRQKAFKLMDEYHKLVIKLGGTMSAEHNDGRLRTPYLEAQHGKEIYGLFAETKKIFDPHGILNPGVKFDTTPHELVTHLRNHYSVDHLHDYLPYS